VHGQHRALGAHFVHVDGWELPGWYEDPIMERRAARRAAGLADASHQGIVVLRGPDRRAILDGLVTDDILHLDRFHGVAACLLTPAGTVAPDDEQKPRRVFTGSFGFSRAIQAGPKE